MLRKRNYAWPTLTLTYKDVIVGLPYLINAVCTPEGTIARSIKIACVSYR